MKILVIKEIGLREKPNNLVFMTVSIKSLFTTLPTQNIFYSHKHSYRSESSIRKIIAGIFHSFTLENSRLLSTREMAINSNYSFIFGGKKTYDIPLSQSRLTSEKALVKKNWQVLRRWKND